jgi:cold shock protein
MNTTKVKGIVKWFNDSKGYGFIDCDSHKDIFVHYSAILGNGFKTLGQGQAVTFTLVLGPKGAQAYEIEREPLF